jgi:hypothetical protein
MCLAGVTPLGGPDCILLVLGPFLTMRIHPEIRHKDWTIETRS